MTSVAFSAVLSAPTFAIGIECNADEITGIEGSTRMEAKRQRRKESRAAGRRRAPPPRRPKVAAPRARD